MAFDPRRYKPAAAPWNEHDPDAWKDRRPPGAADPTIALSDDRGPAGIGSTAGSLSRSWIDRLRLWICG